MPFGKDKVIAIVGASQDPAKYGNIVLKDLISADWNVIPVNPKGGEIHGLKVYAKLADIAGTIDGVVFVTPPAVTVAVMAEANDLGIKDLWMQPGADGPAALQYCQENKLKCTSKACIMVQKNNLKN